MHTYLFGRQSHGKLEYRDVADPSARSQQIIVKIHASSLNPHDWKYYDTLKRICRLPIPFPALTLGHDLSGTVVDVGRKVSRFKIGDPVYAMSMKTGAFGEYLALDHRMAARKPEKLSHREAGGMPMAALTAWQFYMLAKLRAGERVLVVGGSGGVGSQAVQIARAKGAHVTAVCSTRNLDLVASLGAEKIIDYTQEEVLDSGQRFDVVFDTIGTIAPLAAGRILKPKGRFLSTVTNARIIMSALMSRFPGIPIPSTSTMIALPIGRHLEDIGKLVDDGVIRPVIDREFDIRDLENAIVYSKSGRARGKIILVIPEDVETSTER